MDIETTFTIREVDWDATRYKSGYDTALDDALIKQYDDFNKDSSNISHGEAIEATKAENDRLIKDVPC